MRRSLPLNDWEKRLLLRRLKGRDPKGPPLLRFEAPGEGNRMFRGVATREGVFRFGIDLATAALDAGGHVSIGEYGDVRTGDFDGIAAILIADEPHVPLEPRARGAGVCGVIVLLILATVGFLALFGLFTLIALMVRGGG